MAQKSLELLTDDKLNQAFRKNAKKRAVKCFDRELIIPQYEAYYEEILNR